MKTSLCAGWEFTPAWSEAFANFETPAEPVQLPHNPVQMPLHYSDHTAYQLVCGYRRRLELGRECRNGKTYLQFDGAGHIATVYVNGREAGSHHCGYTAFRLDVSDFVNPGENTVAVKLDTTENPSVPPFGFVIDYLTYGGLYREAWLIQKNFSHIRDVFVFTPTVDTAEIRVDAGDFPGEYQLTIRDAAGNPVWEGRSRKSRTVTPVLPVQPWSPDSPVLYTLEAVLHDGDRTEDTETVAFGFRTAQFRADGFYLNGQKLFLRGLNRHQCYPYIGYAATKSLQQEDARILKEELQCNAVRTSHYPQSHHFLEACDRLGLLVFTEIPGWQHIGDEQWKQQAVRNTEEMVAQYRNHPSIILWGVRINESQDDDALYKQTNKAAHRLDPSRATSGVRYLEKSRLLEDVYAYNDFSHTGQNPGCKPKKKVTPNMRRALLISEHNGHMFPTKAYDPWERRQEHALRHLHVLNAAYADGEHAGCFGWCMFDYATHKDFGSGDRICYHGVMDAFRNPKLASAAYASQGSGQTVLEVGSPMDIGDYAAGNIGQVYVFSNADEVALFKNDVFVTRLHRGEEKALPHAPFVVDDTIGELLESQEGFGPAKAQRIKECLLAVGKYGMGALPLKYKLKFLGCMLRYHMQFADGMALYGKYVGNWGGEATRWRFDAIVNGTTVRSVTKCPSDQLHLEVTPSTSALQEGDTYDMAAVRIRVLDSWNNPAPYAQLPVSLEAEGAVQLVGPALITLEGGMSGTYLRTCGESGPAALTVSAPGMPPVRIEFTVEA